MTKQCASRQLINTTTPAAPGGVPIVRTISDFWGPSLKPKTEYAAWLSQDLRVGTLCWVARWAEHKLPDLDASRIQDDFPETKDALSCEDLIIGLCASLDLWRRPGGPPPLAAYDRLLRHRVRHWNQVLLDDFARRAFSCNWFGEAATAAMADMHRIVAFESVQIRHLNYLRRQREATKSRQSQNALQMASVA